VVVTGYPVPELEPYEPGSLVDARVLDDGHGRSTSGMPMASP
jgi:hypothetical protein